MANETRRGDFVPQGAFAIVPAFSTSLDALAPVEARLREAGWQLDVNVGNDGAMARWWNTEQELAACEVAPTEARARAEASLMALQALNSPTKEARDG